MLLHPRHTTHARSFVTVLFVFFVVTGSLVSFVHVASEPVAAHDGAHDTPLGTGSLGSTDPSDFTTETVVDGLVQPISLTFLPDGRMLVLEKGGRIVITDPSDTSLDSQTYMTLTNIDTTGERGLISIVVDPQFLQNGYFYLYYQPATPAQSRVARFQHVENSGGLSSRGDRSSETVIWENPDTYVGEYHFGGGLEFGPDGLLYLTTGEEFDPALSQDLSNAGGKIHRFSPNGTVPADNPFLDNASAIDSVWAYGLRNPYRAKWDLSTHRFFVGDVGGNVVDSREEVNLGEAGANYAWPICEGDCAGSEYTDPLYSYPHRDVGGSIISGPVYRGNQYPSAYTGAYFFADYAYNELRYLTFDDTGAVTGDYLFRTFAGRPVDLVEGPDGALYSPLIAYGNVKRVEYKFATDSPYITGAGADVTQGDAPLTVEFTGFAEDPNDEALTYTWEFGDGTTATGSTVTHTYSSTGVYQARLRVTDASGNEDISDPIEITVGSGPVVQIGSPTDGSTFVAGDTITFSGSATTAAGDPVPPEDLSWTVLFTHNDHTHPVLGPVSGSSGSFDIARTGHDYHGDTGYRISLTATDTSTGVSSTQSVDIDPEKVDLTIDTSPDGIDVSIDGIPDTTPYVYDTLIGFDHTLTAPAAQCVAGTTYEFDSWSDGGARSHVVRVPTTDTTYTATYVASGPCTSSGVPTDGLVAQYESTQGLSTSGGTVTGWSDVSGNGNDLTAVGDPQVASDAPNGEQVVAFDGTGDALVRTGLTGFPSGDADRTVVALVRYDSPGYGGVGYGSPALNQLFGLSVNPDGEMMVQGWGRRNDFHTTTVGTGAGWLTQAAVHSNGALTHYKDGTVIDSASHAFATTTDRIVMGAEIDEDPYVDMDVAAVFVYDRALSDTERQQVEEYLQQQYVTTPTTSDTAPVAADDSASVAQGGSVTVDVLANDADADGDIDPSSVRITEYPVSGDVSVDSATGAVTYDHDGSSSTSDSFRYTVADSTANVSNEAVVSVSISGSPPPSDLPVTSGLALHLDSTTGVATSGGAVTTWADQSGNGNDLTASGGPTLATSPTGAQVVRFDGVDDVASRTGGLAAVPTGDGDRTMFVVAEYREVGYGGVAYGLPKRNQVFGLAVDPNGDLMVQGWGGPNDYVSTTAGTGTGWFTQSVVHSNGAFTHYKDGTAIDSATHTFATDNDRLVVGAEMTPAPYLDMDVAAVIIYDRALSDTERQQVEDYLQQQYVGTGTSTASVSITDPTEGATVTGSDLSVSWDATAAQSGDHVHLSLDGGPVVDDRPLSGTYTFTGVAAGSHTVTATVADSGHAAYTNPGATDSVTVTLEAATTNSPPVATDDSASVSQGGSTTVDVLANDDDPDGSLDPTTVQVTSYPASGTLVVDAATGAIEYTHDGSATTSDSFAYTVDDDAGATSNEATVSVSVSSSPPPSDLPVTSGLALHLDSTTGVTTSGGSVTTWADQSGNGNDLTASGGPSLATSPTGAQVVRFDGVDDVASRTGGLAAVPTGDADRTMFVVAEYREVGYGGVAYGSPSTNDAFGLSVGPDGNLMVQGWGGSNDYISTTAGTGAGWLTQSVVHSNGAFTHYRDGTSIDSATHSFTTTANRIVVGAEMTPAPYLDMDVAAVVIYDRALTDTERQQVEDYLQQTYVGSGGSTSTASVSITDPTEGATVTGSDLSVSWDATAAQSGDHVHLSLDGGAVVDDRPLSGTYTFTGVAAGSHTVTATVADSGHAAYTNSEATDSVTVTLEAASTDTAPVATDDSASVAQGGSVTVDVLANDADADGDIDPTTVQVTSYPASGTLVVDAATGAIEYTHDGSVTTSDSFAYTVADSTGNVSNEAVVSVSISTSSSDLPVTSGLALHLDSTTGVTTSGGSVTTWADQSGNGNDLTASGGPTLATSPTGAQVVRFDGVDDVASRTGGLTGVPTGNADRTVFVVAEYREVGYGGVAYGLPKENQVFGLSVDPNGDLMVQGWGGPNDYVSTTAGTGTGWFTQSAVHSNGAFTHYKDGTAIDSATHTFATDNDRLVVGAEMTPAPYLDMDVAAVVIYDRALTDTERQQVEAYLQQTYVG
ncbi:hypothetical protein C2R22_15360 [Salinigranum rubrum]|uniref:PKD domain-containing protein n=1 Tax=Salinigranum rubrum TaxID=755307 RepID=A0A2I8VLT7_9EURY|nr:PQQ-dependent sugar dehydrogenase [Salinigranum rubrum]AUV82844.1 hypothetical protein C2R22_15360 [Salinigranum rubrum]